MLKQRKCINFFANARLGVAIRQMYIPMIPGVCDEGFSMAQLFDGCRKFSRRPFV